MNLLPKASASRPRLACEILPGGVVAGRSAGPGQGLAGVARVSLPEGAIAGSLKPGNIPDRMSAIAALRRALEQVGGRPNARSSEITLIIPDAAVRVLLLDFDALPAKLSEALPIVRFRLKKLLPFDADDAMVSFQVMSSSRSVIRVLAVAVPRDVLSEYETAAREAGFEPGAVLPSTLAALGALDEGEGAALLVNAHEAGVTTAIVRGGIVLLHRTVELGELPAPTSAGVPAALFGSLDPTASGNGGGPALLGRAGEDEDPDVAEAVAVGGGYVVDMYASEAAPASRSPYASPVLQRELQTGFMDGFFPGSEGEEALPANLPEHELPDGLHDSPGLDRDIPVHGLAPDVRREEVARAVSVAIAYFEDTLASAPEVLLSAGPLGAEALRRTLQEQGVAQGDGVRVRDLLDASPFAQLSTTAVPLGWLAGVAGALRS